MSTITEQKQMDAIVIQSSGLPAESLALRTEAVPQAGPGEVLIEVRAAGVSPFDAVNALGYIGTPLPVISGLDYAGVVVSEGPHQGREVYGSALRLGMSWAGTHANYIALPETWLSTKPESLSMVEAGAIGVAYSSAWHTLIEMGQLKPGETVLITAGTGSVGRAAAQIARWRGATPIVGGRRDPGDAEHFIDTTTTDLAAAVQEITGGRGADLVLDTFGGSLLQPAIKSLRFRGRLVGLISKEQQVEIDVADLYAREIQISALASLFLEGTEIASTFDQLGVLFDKGVLTPPAYKTWPLAQAAEAYQAVLEGTSGVKQVLLPA